MSNYTNIYIYGKNLCILVPTEQNAIEETRKRMWKGNLCYIISNRMSCPFIIPFYLSYKIIVQEGYDCK